VEKTLTLTNYVVAWLDSLLNHRINDFRLLQVIESLKQEAVLNRRLDIELLVQRLGHYGLLVGRVAIGLGAHGETLRTFVEKKNEQKQQ
jgi:hypothetical protein